MDTTLQRLFQHNAWAYEQVFQVCLAQSAGLLDQEAPGTSGTISGTLKHLTGVEDVLFAQISGAGVAAIGPFEAYEARDVIWFAQRSAQLASDYLDWLSQVDDSALEQPLQIPWFDFPVTVREGFIQVLTNSA